MEISIYHNPSYLGSETYTIYIKDGGLYKTNSEETCRIMPTPSTGIIDETNVDTYLASREFFKVLEMSNDKVDWFNGYNDKKEEILVMINMFAKKLVEYNRHEAFNSVSLSNTFSILARLMKILN